MTSEDKIGIVYDTVVTYPGLSAYDYSRLVERMGVDDRPPLAQRRLDGSPVKFGRKKFSCRDLLDKLCEQNFCYKNQKKRRKKGDERRVGHLYIYKYFPVIQRKAYHDAYSALGLSPELQNEMERKRREEVKIRIKAGTY